MNTEFKRGVRESLPIVFGVLPFGLILGAQAMQKGMSSLETMLMMWLNFAGGSEFATVGAWTSPIPVLLIWTLTLMINSRHIFMGAAFAPYLRDLPLRKLLPTLFVMIDETWAMGMAVFTRCGLTADLSFFVNFYSLTLFAAGGPNNDGVNDGGGCFLYFWAFFGQLAVNQF